MQIWYPHCSLLLHLACVWVPRIHKHDLMTLLDAINQHSQFPCCEKHTELYYLQLCKNQITHVAAPNVFILVHLPPGPDPLSLSRLSTGAGPWAAKKASLTVLSCCPEAAFSGRCHKGEWRFLHARQVPFPLCSISTIWQGKSKGSLWLWTGWWTHTYSQAQCRCVCTRQCIYIHKLTVLHMWWIFPTGLYTIGYYTDGNSQFTYLPMLFWERAVPQRAHPGCPKVPDACRTSLSLSYSSLALLSIFLSFQHFSFSSPPISFHFCDFHPAKISY